MFNPTHLTLSRHNVYYLRFPIPKALHPTGKATEIKVSLKTRCPHEALHLSRTLVYAASSYIKGRVFTSMDYQEIRAILTNHFNTVLESRKAKIAAKGALSVSETAREEIHMDAISREIEVNREAYPKSTWKYASDEVIEALLPRLNIDIPKGTREFELFRVEYLKAQRDTIKKVLDYNAGFDGYTLGATTNEPIAALPTASTAKLIDIYNLYEDEKLKLKHWTPKTAKDSRSQISLLVEFLGQDEPMDITNKRTAEVKTMLVTIPKQPRNKPKYKRLSIPELMRLKHDEGMSEKNINKYLQTYSGLYDWAVRRGDITNNYFKHLITKLKNKEAPRDAFSLQQMEIMKAALVSNGKGYKDHHKWCTLIAMYTGARLNEIAQLEIADIITEEGSLCFHFTNQVKSSPDNRKSIKTRNSIRFLPVHSCLIEFGLNDYVSKIKKAGHTRLFPELPYDKNNGYGRNVGRWFSKFFLKDLGIKTEKLSFHSFRHTVASCLLQVDVQEPIVKSITGHAGKGVLQEVYAKGYTISQKVEALSKLPY